MGRPVDASIFPPVFALGKSVLPRAVSGWTRPGVRGRSLSRGGGGAPGLALAGL